MGAALSFSPAADVFGEMTLRLLKLPVTETSPLLPLGDPLNDFSMSELQ